MAEFKSISELLYDWGDKTIELLTASLEKEKATATRNLMQSIKYDVKILGDIYTFTLSMADYWKWVDAGRGATTGRGKGGDTLQERIYKWISFKGFTLQGLKKKGFSLTKKQRKKISKKAAKPTSRLLDYQRRSLSFLIARKIHRKGYAPRRFYSKVVTPNYLDDFRNDLRMALNKDLRIEVMQIFQDIKKR